MNRDTATWGEDALMFNPDKFLDSEWSINGTNHQYLPFGAGRRYMQVVLATRTSFLLHTPKLNL